MALIFKMRSISRPIALGTLVVLAAAADQITDTDLARALASESRRQQAVDSVVGSGTSKVALLLGWTHKPPAELHDLELPNLYVGMADVFGRLKTREAIPFLIKNISLERGVISMPDTFLHPPRVIEDRLPAAAALISIGRPASSRIIRVFWDLPSQDRLAAIFTVSRIASSITDSAKEREFLWRLEQELGLERHWAEQGLTEREKR